MEEEGSVGRNNGSVRSFFPVRMAYRVVRWFDWGISSVFRFNLYLYWLVARRYPIFLEDTIKQLENENVDRLTKEKNDLAREKDEALRRLSEVVSVRLRDNNPNIADLNDQCRPTKLSEMFSELYDNEWTAAYSIFETRLNEASVINVLLMIMMQAYKFCEDTVAEPWNVVTKWFIDKNLPGSQQTSKWLKDSRKSTIRSKVPEVLGDFKKSLMRTCQENKISGLFEDNVVHKYMAKCVELSLLMVTTDPPLVILCPKIRGDCKGSWYVGKGRTFMHNADGRDSGEKNKEEQEKLVGQVAGLESEEEEVVFNKDLFKEYTHRGKYFDYIVWPALLLHKDGPLLSKGIAQGTNNITISNSDGVDQ